MSENIVDIICEFLEVVIHNILYVRKLYPDAIFSEKSKYGIVVYKSIHPGLNEYIENTLKTVHYHLKANQLKKMFICLNYNEDLIEKYVLDIISFSNTAIGDSLYISLEQDLRTFLLKLQSIHLYLNPVHRDATFTIELQLFEESHISLSDNASFEDFPWMNVNEDNLQQSNIIPLNDIKSDNVNIQIYAEKY